MAEQSEPFDKTGTLIYTSEVAYYIISELITMPDRELAGRIELFLWPKSPCVPPNRIRVLCEAMEKSEDDGDFARLAANILDLWPEDGFPRPDKAGDNAT